MQQFITEWWPAIIPVILALAKLMNKMSQHWTSMSWVKRPVGFLVEVLDLVRIPELTPKSSTKKPKSQEK